MGMSNKAYARHRGVSPAAVRKALEYGRITKEADGTIDPVKADRDWAANTLPRDGADQVSGGLYFQTADLNFLLETAKISFKEILTPEWCGEAAKVNNGGKLP